MIKALYDIWKCLYDKTIHFLYLRSNLTSTGIQCYCIHSGSSSINVTKCGMVFRLNSSAILNLMSHAKYFESATKKTYIYSWKLFSLSWVIFACICALKYSEPPLNGLNKSENQKPIQQVKNGEIHNWIVSKNQHDHLQQTHICFLKWWQRLCLWADRWI